MKISNLALTAFLATLTGVSAIGRAAFPFESNLRRGLTKQEESCGSFSLDFSDFGVGDFVDDLQGPLASNFGGLAITCTKRQLDKYEGLAAVDYGCRIFDSANPTGDDPDLGSPNEKCEGGGPGVGVGGEPGAAFPNCDAAGNVMIIDENGPTEDPDDAQRGGSMEFSFSTPVNKPKICLLDMDGDKNTLKIYYKDTMVEKPIPNTGDNGQLCVPLPFDEVTKLEVSIKTSGAVISLDYTLSECIPCGAPCDDDDFCTIDTCDAETDTCVYEPVQCGENQACDSFTGLCQDIQNVVPCVAVIDEWNNRDYSSTWQTFRETYPQRPFCLLVPSTVISLLPTGFENDTVANPDGIDRTLVVNVNRDNGDTALASDWFNACELGSISPASLTFIGLFIDTSGSMTLSTVQASYDQFLADLSDAGLVFDQVFNPSEQWIDPFLTTLAPP